MTNTILILLFSTFVGWISTLTALKLLHSPRKPVRIGFWRLQGLIPQVSDAIKSELGTIIREELISEEKIAEKLDRIHIDEEVEQLLDERLNVLVDRVKEKIPLAGMFLAGSISENLRNQAKEELLGLFPELKKIFQQRFREGFDIDAMIEKKLSTWDLDRFALRSYPGARKQLHRLTLVGASIGLLVGFIEIALI